MAILPKNQASVSNNTRQPSEFDGIWLNIGMNVESTNEKGEKVINFVRLSRGVAVADLVKRKIYPNTDPELAEQFKRENQMIDEIQAAGLSLEEGGSWNTEILDVQLYRKIEEVDTAREDVAAEKIGIFK